MFLPEPNQLEMRQKLHYKHALAGGVGIPVYIDTE